jgi:transcriptional regulator with XRE-family HTH domain
MITKKTKFVGREYLRNLIGERESVGSFLWAIRTADEIPQSVFARKLGISKQHLCDIEKKRKLVSPERAAAFGRILGYGEEGFVQLALQDIIHKSGLKYEIEIKKVA